MAIFSTQPTGFGLSPRGLELFLNAAQQVSPQAAAQFGLGPERRRPVIPIAGPGGPGAFGGFGPFGRPGGVAQLATFGPFSPSASPWGTR